MNQQENEVANYESPVADTLEKDTSEKEVPRGAVPKRGPGSRLVAALLAPSELFEDINLKPTFLAPMVIVAITSIAFVLFINWRLKPDWRQFARSQTTAQSELMPAPQPTDRQIEFRAKLYKFLPALAPVFALAWYLAAAGVLTLGMRRLHAQTNYDKVLSVFAWSDCSVRLVYTLIVMGSIMMRAPETLGYPILLNPGSTVLTNLSFVLSQNTSPAVRVIASSIDIFSIWQIALLVIGLAAIGGTPRITRSKTGLLVVGLWLVIIIIRAGLAAVGSSALG
jgi:hypothetical protein